MGALSSLFDQSSLQRRRSDPLRRVGTAVGAVLVLLAGGCRELERSADIVGPPDPELPPTATFVVAATDYTYTTDADFDEGTLVSVNHDAAPNQLQLNETSGTFPFIWIALSVRCTIAKVNTETGAILGEYRTLSDAVGCSQSSRTTVAIDGSVWVGHRGRGGVTHVGLAELNQCVDRNANGTIETSTGYGDVLAWPGSTSDVTEAVDECILHHVNTDTFNFGDSRHMSIDASNKLWVGSFSGVKGFVRVDGATGTVETPVTNVQCGGYGGLIDANGVIWSANGGSSGLLRWDPDAPTVPGTNPVCIPIANYGLAIDQDGWVWATQLSGNVVRKISPDGATILGPFSHGSSNAQGLAVDASGDVWVSSSLFCGANCTIGHLKNDGTFVGNVPNPQGAGSTGVSIDANGNVWSANLNSNTATRIDPSGGGIGADGVTPIGAVDLVVNFPAGPGGRPTPSPYNYSDMTGAQLFGSTAPQGSWTIVQDGGAAGTEWGTIQWNTEAEGSVPSGASITVEARAADTEAGLGGQAFAPVSNNVAFSLTGRFIQVRVTLRSSSSGESPVLSDLSIASVSDGGDTTPPACFLSGQGTDGSGRKYIEVTARDQASGLASIQVTTANNLDAVVPPFTTGTTGEVVVRATKINQASSSQLALRVSDVAGNSTDCDPIDVTLERYYGKPITMRFDQIPQAEYWVEVHNGFPGLTELHVIVNGRKYVVKDIGNGLKTTLNVRESMRPGNSNQIWLEARGQPGGTAWVLIRD